MWAGPLLRPAFSSSRGARRPRLGHSPASRPAAQPPASPARTRLPPSASGATCRDSGDRADPGSGALSAMGAAGQREALQSRAPGPGVRGPGAPAAQRTLAGARARTGRRRRAWGGTGPGPGWRHTSPSGPAVPAPAPARERRPRASTHTRPRLSTAPSLTAAKAPHAVARPHGGLPPGQQQRPDTCCSRTDLGDREEPDTRRHWV